MAEVEHRAFDPLLAPDPGMDLVCEMESFMNNEPDTPFELSGQELIVLLAYIDRLVERANDD